MKQKYGLILIILAMAFLISINSVFAGNNTTVSDNTPREFLPASSEEVSATEDGHFNITFDKDIMDTVWSMVKRTLMPETGSLLLTHHMQSTTRTAAMLEIT